MTLNRVFDGLSSVQFLKKNQNLFFFAKNDDFLYKSLRALMLGNTLFLHVFYKKHIFLKTLLSIGKSFWLRWFLLKIIVDFSVKNTYVYWKFMFCVFWKKKSDWLSMHILSVLMKKCEKTEKTHFFVKTHYFWRNLLRQKELENVEIRTFTK